MKKIFCAISLITLAACQSPYNRNVYQATGPRVCVEYWDSFRCSAPQKVWNETVYPKNNTEMVYTSSVYLPYQPQSLSKVVYGTM